MSWREFALGTAIHVKHGYAFKGEFFTDEGEFIVLTPGNFNEEGGFRIRLAKDRAYAGEIPEEFILAEGDLIIAMTEQGPGLLGSSALIPKCNRIYFKKQGKTYDKIYQSHDKQGIYFINNTVYPGI